MALLKLDNEAELKAKLEVLFEPSSEAGWVLLDYSGPESVKFVASGTSGLEDLKQHLKDDKIQYAKIRLSGIKEKGALKDTTRDVFVLSFGKDVPIIERGLKAQFLNRAEHFLQPFHAAVDITNKAHFDLATLLDRSHPLSGSHEID